MKFLFIYLSIITLAWSYPLTFSGDGRLHDAIFRQENAHQREEDNLEFLTKALIEEAYTRQNILRRDTTVETHGEKNEKGSNVGGSVDHTSQDGKTHAEAHVDHNSNTGTSYGGSISHTFGRRDIPLLKRDTTVEAHTDHDKSGTNVGASVSHQTDSGSSVNAHVDHHSQGGTSYGGGLSHTINHSDGSKTSIGGDYTHDSRGGDNVGLSVSHSFPGKRNAKRSPKILIRDTTVETHGEKNEKGSNVGGSVDHTSQDGKTHAEAHVDHNSNTGTSYGGSISHTFGRRDIPLLKRATTVEAHTDHDKSGTNVGASVSHQTDSGSSVNAHVDHHSQGGTSYGGGLSHTINHSDGSKTSIGGDYTHDSRGGDNVGLSVSHSFPGKRNAQRSPKITKRDTTVETHGEKNEKGSNVGGSVDHTSQDGKTHAEAHVDHNSNTGTSYGGSISHTFGRRDIPLLKRDTTVEAHTDHDKSGTNVGASVSHQTDSGSSVNAHVDHHSQGGTSYGGGLSHTINHSDGSKTSIGGDYTHDSHGGDNVGLSVSHTFGRRLAELENVVEELQQRDTTVETHGEKNEKGSNVGGSVDHTSQDGKTHAEAHVDHNSNTGTSYGGSISHTFGRRDIPLLKRDTTVEAHTDHDKSGTNVGASVSHQTDSGSSVNAHVDHHSQGGTSYGGGLSHTINHSDGSKTSIGGDYTHDSHGGDNVGLTVSHSFPGKRNAKRSPKITIRDTTVETHGEKNEKGSNVGGSVDHTSQDGKTHAEAHVDHNSNTGTSYGGSISHTFGRRDIPLLKRATTVEAHTDHDKSGTNVGASVSHQTDSGSSVNAHVDHHSQGGTSYGGGLSHTINHSDGSKTSIGGDYTHDSHGGDNVGLTVSHSFPGKRDAKRSPKITKRDTTVETHGEKNEKGSNVGGSVDHTSQDGKTHAEAHVDHNSNTGTSYGGSISHTFGRRDIPLLKRATTVEAHTDHDKSGTNVGASVSHQTDSGSSVNAHVDHHSQGGTSYGGGLSHTINHSDGSKTSIGGDYTHDSHGGDNVGLSVSHTFGRRLAELENVVEELQQRDTTVETHGEKNEKGSNVGGSVDHTSQDGKTHAEAHVDHNSNTGTSYGGSISHTFGRRDIPLLKRDTTVEAHTDHDKSGTNVGASVSHQTDSGSSVNAHVDHHSQGGTSYGGGLSHTINHSDGSKTSFGGDYTHDSHGGDNIGLSVSHTFGRRLAELENVVEELQQRDTTVETHGEKNEKGSNVGGSVDHTSQDGKTHAEAHVDHNSNTGTSYGGSISHTFSG